MSFGYSETSRGFRQVRALSYPTSEDSRVLQESSAVGEYEDSLDRPGSSYLWVGRRFHLDRDDVEEVIAAMQCWLDTGSLPASHEMEVSE